MYNNYFLALYRLASLLNPFVLVFLPYYSIHSLFPGRANFWKRRNNSLGSGEAVVICDFSENYSMVVQDATQGYHWKNTQATIHPFAIYLKGSSATSTTFYSFAVVSDCLTHDTAALYLFQRQLMTFLKRKYDLKKIFSFSDGAVS